LEEGAAKILKERGNMELGDTISTREINVKKGEAKEE